MNQAVILDVDGVLVDSYDAHFRSWRQLGEATGVAFTERTFAETFGRTSRTILEQVWGETNAQRTRELDDRKEALYREIVAENFPAMPGAAELIRALQEAGFALAVGSSGPPENIDLALRQLDVEHLIDVRVTGRDVTRGKPDPQVFQLAAQRLGVPPARSVVVEDAAAGVAAAHAAGMESIALVSTGRRRADFAEVEPSLIVDDLRQLTVADIHQLLPG